MKKPRRARGDDTTRCGNADETGNRAMGCLPLRVNGDHRSLPKCRRRRPCIASEESFIAVGADDVHGQVDVLGENLESKK